MQLTDKNIVVGVSGGIAAYKSADLIRRLKEQGANVRVVMSEGGKAFITPLTLQAVSGNPVSDSLLDPEAEAGMGHIELAKWADLILIAPASADIIARLNAGMANDLLTTICLATAAPIAIAPAMNQQMWHTQVTQNNVDSLQSRGYLVWGPGQGEQACGDVGFGRMLEPTELCSYCVNYFAGANKPGELDGQTWVITAGPTREPMDPVRYISNHSSGKMGFAIALAAQLAGAKVYLIAGPVKLATPTGVERIDVETALQMQEQSMAHAEHADVFVACAAVADYRVAEVASQKIKKSTEQLQLVLEKNPDIVAGVAALENAPFTVGFAAETENVEEYALGKLKKKNLQMICANNVSAPGHGFNSDTNALTIFWSGGSLVLPLTSKQELARQLVGQIAKKFNQSPLDAS
ncbi:bifunctional phosphopantothenoylcysteine decarboxylase/phosphopantothenate--cysteine ligase CoaBC [Thalassotalea sp. PS06]|uniref:bifunctional phosphopantothenoylcysteine decarboxylase/phosphopantothenate--cysteine ligase CoaBC n=1 Tax=Thalassotalea sp. PS06 TaxID=2594005 RepID=UPI001162481B|nr:bifunctional phosphopantothenoylcysteine decarboxylase/phosphopantothenate--cysteine ligase CoaBC [Thalassotalea sp. PS06]QDP02550.1 bifunctional phosphopantothenoylcysteine decarboxylase/phosphopantothenate--cysteine ligase CoaBC [Thalassotalea sp. PS06]